MINRRSILKFLGYGPAIAVAPAAASQSGWKEGQSPDQVNELASVMARTVRIWVTKVQRGDLQSIVSRPGQYQAFTYQVGTKDKAIDYKTETLIYDGGKWINYWSPEGQSVRSDG